MVPVRGGSTRAPSMEWAIVGMGIRQEAEGTRLLDFPPLTQGMLWTKGAITGISRVLSAPRTVSVVPLLTRSCSLFTCSCAYGVLFATREENRRERERTPRRYQARAENLSLFSFCGSVGNRVQGGPVPRDSLRLPRRPRYCISHVPQVPGYLLLHISQSQPWSTSALVGTRDAPPEGGLN